MHGRPGSDEVRILGAAVEAVEEFRSRETRNSGLFRALDDRFSVVGFVRPDLPKLEDYALKLWHFHPNGLTRRGRTSLSSWGHRRRTALAERQLASRDGDFDVILLLQTLFHPGERSKHRPFVVYTDNTYSLTRRLYPSWAPLSRRQDASWLRLEEATCRDAAIVFAMSDFVRNALISDYGCDPDRVVKVGSGTNLVGSLENKRYDRQVFLFVGMNFELKGGNVLLRAWEEVTRTAPDAELWVVGPKRPPSRLPKGVRWIGFVESRAELANLLDQASAFVLPSFFDASPHAVREAMGYGLPCVGSDRGGIPELIVDGETGFVVPAGDADALAGALSRLLEDPDTAERFGRLGYQHATTLHSWSGVVERMGPHLDAAAAGTATRLAPRDA